MNPRGLTTGPIPYGSTNSEVCLNLLDNRLETCTGIGEAFEFSLDDLPVGEFYRKLVEGLATIGIQTSINMAPRRWQRQPPPRRSPPQRVARGNPALVSGERLPGRRKDGRL